ncbi:MAG: putative bifunctional diguanylate cyclase/phosphodiesterase [Actinomycetales bacterium]
MSPRSASGVVPLAVETVALGVIGVAAASLSTAHPVLGPNPAVMFVVCATLFLLAEFAKIHVEVRTQALSVSFSDLPLVLGLFTLDVWWLIAARLLGTGIAVLVTRPAMHKAMFNLALFTAEVGIGYLLFSTLGELGWGPQLDWVKAAAVVLTTGTVGVCSVVLAITLLQGLPSAREVGDMITSVLLSGLLSGSMALLSLLALEAGPAGYGLLLVVAMGMTLAFRSYSRLMRQHADLGEVLNAARKMSSSATTADLIIQLTDQAAQLVSAEQSQVWLPGVPTLDQSLPSTGSAPAIIRRDTRDPAEREWLAKVGFRDAIVMPIVVDGTEEGALVVHNRLGAAATFNTGDLHLLQTLVTHASAVWNNMNLLGRLRHEATHDHLTNLPNRSAFTAAVERMLADQRSHAQHGALAAVLLLDLDRFKEVNDVLGHPTGDHLLQQVARRLAATAPPGSMLARFGGDEFAVLLPEISGPLEAEAIAQRLADCLVSPFTLAGSVIDVSASVGIARVSNATLDAATLMRHVDIAMYTAKNRAPTFAWYSPDEDRGSVDRLNLVGQLRQAINSDQITIDFQPQVRLDTREVVGFEALSRWTHPQRGPIAPEEFIPLADQTGQVGVLTMLALRKAIEQAASWRDDLSVSVNLPARLLLEPGLPIEIGTIISEVGVDPNRVIIELTEDSLMSYHQDTLRPLHQLRATGVRLSIDDFGTGYSSLAYLRQLPVQEIKIDKSFMVGVSEAPAAAALVRSIVEVSHVLGLVVVAEGVEDYPTLEVLTRLGCDVGQGYLLARPMAAESIPGWLANHP